MKSKKTKFYFITFFIFLSFLVFSSEKALAANACFNPSKPEISGICQTFSCDEGSVTISNTRCSENLFATTCCSVPSNQKTQTTTSATNITNAKPATNTSSTSSTTISCIGDNEEKGHCETGWCSDPYENIGDKGDKCSWSVCCGNIASAKTSATSPKTSTTNNPATSTSGSGLSNTAVTTGTPAGNATGTTTTAQTFGTQCKGVNDLGSEINCSSDNNEAILTKQCEPLFGKGSCGSMSTYLTKLSNTCIQWNKDNPDVIYNCDLIKVNGVYGKEASEFASRYIKNYNQNKVSSTGLNSSSGNGNSGTGNSNSSAGALGSGSSVGTGILDLPTGVGLPDPAGGIKEILTNLLKWFLGIVGIVAMIAFVVSGVQYFLVSADEKMATDAKKNMTFAIIGIIVALSGFVIIKAIDTALNAKGLF